MTIKLIRLVVGLIIVSLAIALSLKAQLGFAPWEVFHSGLSNISHISIGRITIITSFVIISLSFFLGIYPGIGTLLNMLLVGVFVDLFMQIPLEMYLTNVYTKLTVLIISIFLMAIGSFLYIGAGLGSGPRDAITVRIAQRTSFHMGTCKAMVDGVILLLGMILGGSFGIGTILNVLFLGLAIKVVFSVFDFDIKSVEHLSFLDIFRKPVYIEIPKEDKDTNSDSY